MRRVAADDWRRYREIRLEGLREAPTAFARTHREEAERPDDFWRDRVTGSATGDRRATFVAVAGGRIVGTSSGVVEDEITEHWSVQVVAVYTTPAFRGGAVGASGRLLDSVLGWAYRDAAADRVRLYVMDTNDRAREFYRRHGFRASGEHIPYPLDPALREEEMVHRPDGLRPPAARTTS